MSPIFVGGRRILGALSADPTTGLTAGDEYFNTTNNVKRVYTGTAWANVGNSTSGPAINTATNWWKNEDIAGTAGTWNWADSVGSQNMIYNLNGGGNSDITITTSTDLGNKDVFKKTSASYGHLLTNTTTAGTFHTNGNSWTAMVVYNKTSHTGGGAYGDAMFVHDRNGLTPQDGSWSLDVAGDHTWGGGYSEVFGTNIPGTTTPNKGIVMFRFNGQNGTIERYISSAWTTLDTASSQPTSAPYSNISLFSFYDATNTSHMFVGEIAEVAFWKGISISDSERNAWSAYLSAKFSI
jgi:hypothetical protein